MLKHHCVQRSTYFCNYSLSVKSILVNPKQAILIFEKEDKNNDLVLGLGGVQMGLDQRLRPVQNPYTHMQHRAHILLLPANSVQHANTL